MADILPPSPIGTPFGSYAWEDWYRKVRDAINNAQIVQFSSITGLPTTLSGYGITDSVQADGTQLRWTAAVTNGAGALTGTLTNSPVTGNPSSWLRVDDNGTVRYIPAW